MLDLVALSPDGLAVNSDGALVHLIEVGRPVNTLVMDEEAMREVSRKLDKVASHVPAHEDLHLYMHASQLAVDDVVADEFALNLRAVRRAQQAGDEDLSVALDRLHASEEHSLRTHSRAVAAKQLRHIIVCPLRPERDGLLNGVGAKRRRRGPLRLTPAELERARQAAFDYAEGILGQLEMAELHGHLLDGFAVLDLLWERMSPNVADDRQPPPSVTHPGVLRELDAASTAEEAAQFTAQLREAICQEPISFSDRGHVTFGQGESRSVVQSIYMSALPDETWLGWLLYLMRAGIPFSLSVHVQATDRYREKMRNIRRYKRLRGLNRGKLRSGKDIEADAEDKEAEAGFLVRHLFRRAGASIYKVSVTLTLREPHGHVDALQAQVKAVTRDMLTNMDARMSSGLFAQHALLRTSLPLGHDEADRRKRMTSLNVGDTFPLVGTGCGSPEGLPLGYAQPGRTLERLDPYSKDHTNHICVVNGKSGTGKTMTTQILLSRAMARGATGFVIDRAGHFAFLCGLIPGAVSLRVGAGDDEHAINPWDVADVAKVPRKKVAYLVALHAQLIGSVDSSDTFGLDALERSQLSVAIREVYKRCQLTGEVPRERILQEVLYGRADDERDAGAHEISAVLRSLAERLHDFVDEGAYAYLTDAETSIPEHAPLMAFDTKDIPNEVVPAALFIIAEAVVRRVEARREAHLAAGGGPGDWTARTFLVIDEAWKLVERPATGRLVMEWGLRSRHLALWLIAITQQMRHLDNQYGRALLDNAAIRLFLNQEEKELRYVQDAIAMSDEAIHCIKALTTDKRRYSNAYLMNGKHGQGTVTIQVSDYEYWATTSDPDNDEPLRQAALRHAYAELGGMGYDTYWRALQLLADPAWHAAQQQRSGRRQLAQAA
jgi:hypothetical protein